MKLVGIIALCVMGLVFIYWKDISVAVAGTNTAKEDKKDKKDKEDKEEDIPLAANFSVVKKWNLPDELKEVSGIAYIDKDRFAAIQDEEGTIFIYNKTSNKIEKQIPFGKPGDYEGMTLVNNTAYVVRADGRLFEVSNFNTGKPTTKEYSTPLTVQHNVEGLCYDKSNNRLLLAIKDDEPSGHDYKGIYGFDLSNKTMAKEPVYKIDPQHEVLKASGKKKNVVQPSAIGINPSTNEMYITDGPNARLLIFDSKGAAKRAYQLGKDFPQAEGVTFSPTGDVFISNEGKKQPGNIMQVQLQ